MLLNIYLWLYGIGMIIPVGIRLFVPFWGLSESLRSLLSTRETTKGFLISHNINGFLLGVILIVTGFLPEHLKLCVCMPLLGAVFISVLICNKIFVGTFWAYVPKNKT